MIISQSEFVVIIF